MISPSLTREDWLLLEVIQNNGRISISDIAKKLGRSRSNVSEKLQKLTDSGVLEHFSTVINEEKLGFGISAFVRITAGSSQHRRIVDTLCELPETAECHVLTGSELVIVRLVAIDMPHLRSLVDLMTEFGETQTDVIFSSVKKKLNVNAELMKSLKNAHVKT